MVTMLLSVIFLSATSAMVTAMKLFNALNDNKTRVDAYIALEHIARKAALSNQAVISESGAQLKLRWDYALDTFAPTATPKNTADDNWVKYRINGNRLYWENTASGADMTAGTELMPGITLLSGSIFEVINPTATLTGSNDPNVVGVGTVVRINLVTQAGSPPVTVTVKADVEAGAMPKKP